MCPSFSQPLAIPQTILAAPDASGFSGVGVERATVGFTPQRTASAPSTSGVCISVGAPRFSRRLAVPQTIHSTPDASGLGGVVAECTSVGLAPQRTFSAVGMPLIRGDPPPPLSMQGYCSPLPFGIGPVQRPVLPTGPKKRAATSALPEPLEKKSRKI